MPVTPAELRERVATGILAFPATPFAADRSLDATRLESHIAELVRHGPSALVPAGGAGEIFSLTLDEYRQVLATTVAGAGGIPVMAGVGNGHGIALEMARMAEAAGADAILLLPPYLTGSEQAGLEQHIAAICAAVSIGVVAYSRGDGVLQTRTALRLAETHENFIGVKDGTANFEEVAKLKLHAGDRLVIINGIPTAEILAQQFFATGVKSFSSAVFTFAPWIPLRFIAALRAGDTTTVERLLRDFYLPLGELRARKRGYAVSIVKAGLAAVGASAGPVRPPLLDLAGEDAATLAALIETARALVV